MVKYFLFDLDGTLINVSIYAEIYQDILNMISESKGISGVELFAKAEESGLLLNEFGRYDSGELCKIFGLLEEYYAVLKRSVAVKKRVHSDALLVLSSLKERGFIVAVVSNSMRRTILSYLEKYLLLEYVDFIFCSDDAGCNKNDSLFWKKLIDSKGLDPKDCVVVGDNKYEDVKVPIEFGFNSFYVGEGGKSLKDVLDYSEG